MTTKNRRSGQQLGSVKVLVVAGGIAASLIGTRLLASNDAQVTAVPTTQPTTIIVNPPAAQTTNSTTGSGSVRLDLPPIPQAISPAVQPITRSRSSR